MFYSMSPLIVFIATNSLFWYIICSLLRKFYLGWSFDKMFRSQFCMSSQRVSRWNFFTKIISSCDNEYSNTSIVLCFSFALEYKVPVDKVPLEYIRHSIDIIRSIPLQVTERLHSKYTCIQIKWPAAGILHCGTKVQV